ncbi:arrestin domain-containing protein 3-like [Eurosta solidaginis]|uniref:arrestin domain-containing protein 3-like n=1 Tax=Eurosta solidaginis TaxID=178769 RepID=UPI003530B03D
MPTKCKFSYERETPVYVCGEKVIGSVEVNFVKEELVEDIRINFRGMATVSWVDTMARFPKIYSAEEVYMENEIIVFQGGDIAAGIYNYSFLFHVADVCPTTCTTDIGRIFYELQLIVAYEDKHKRKFTSEIMVLQRFDINQVPNASLPVIASDEIFFCCWPCSSGPVAVNLKASRAAYVPGNMIEFSIELDNMSKRCKFRINIGAYLMQIYKFTTEIPRRRTRYISYELDDVERRINVKPGEIEIMEECFTIPPLPPSTQGAHIISIKYELRLEIRVNSVSHAMTDLMVPIIIGTADEQTPSVAPLAKRKSRR